jgi:hypothetical protein
MTRTAWAGAPTAPGFAKSRPGRAWGRPGAPQTDPYFLAEPEVTPISITGSAFRGLATLIVSLFRAAWFLLALPFRLVFWTLGVLGRLTGVVIGFSLMVVGMALWASPLFLLGIPIFLIGLVMTLRCLG